MQFLNFNLIHLPRTLLVLLIILPAFLRSTLAQQQTPHSAFSISNNSRIERLAALAKVWGTVKFFHPYLSYQEIDWDKALVETIPKVNTARTPQEYQAALNHLLAFLKDKNTRAELTAKASPQQTSRQV